MGKRLTDAEYAELAERAERGDIKFDYTKLGHMTKRILAERGLSPEEIKAVEAKVASGEIRHTGDIGDLLLAIGLKPVDPPLEISIENDRTAAIYLQTLANYEKKTVAEIVCKLARERIAAHMGKNDSGDAQAARAKKKNTIPHTCDTCKYIEDAATGRQCRRLRPCEGFLSPDCKCEGWRGKTLPILPPMTNTTPPEAGFISPATQRQRHILPALRQRNSPKSTN